MTISLHIESENGKWLLAANYCEKKKRYYGVRMEVNPVENALWDGVSYLYEALFPMVDAMLHNRPTVAVTDENLEVYDYLCENRQDIAQLHEILVKGRELSWDKIS